MRPLVFIPEPIAHRGFELLSAVCECLAPWKNGPESSQNGNQHRELLYEADAVIVRLFRITDTDLQRARRLKIVAKHGVGTDNIDCQAATRRRIPVAYTPNAATDPVAEHTIALMLALARNLWPAHAAVINGEFFARKQFQGVELNGKTLSIIGLGRIGTRVGEIAAKGLRMTVCAYDPFRKEPLESDFPVTLGTFESVLQSADFLSLHLPSALETKHMINARSLALMKPSCRIINTSRGAIVDELALTEALVAGAIAGAALDVFEEEPIPANHPLRRAPNTLFTPHISSSTQESLDRMSLEAAQAVLDVLHGRVPMYLANPEVLQ
jgi:D-3-phosphoglycerate dehydrogenase / 2-oxoglutarate reductase